jgi:hypothetical protein
VAISMASLVRKRQHKPARSMIYGTHGVGKTTLAADAPNPVFIKTEDGLMDDTPNFGLFTTWAEVSEAIATLYSEEHDFQTVVVDTLDWLEPIIWREACQRGGWASIEDAGFGKGYIAASDVWREFLDGMNALRDDKGMQVILLAHSEIKRFDSPEIDPYDRYQPKLHRLGSALVQENVDNVFFFTRLVSTVKLDAKDKNSKVRGVGGGQRVIYTEERPAYLGKNRYSMPPQILIPDDRSSAWSAVGDYLPTLPARSAEAV